MRAELTWASSMSACKWMVRRERIWTDTGQCPTGGCAHPGAAAGRAAAAHPVAAAGAVAGDRLLRVPAVAAAGRLAGQHRPTRPPAACASLLVTLHECQPELLQCAYGHGVGLTGMLLVRAVAVAVGVPCRLH